MAPPPALAHQHVDPLAHAVELFIKALWSSNADRLVLETGQMPVLVTGNRQSALMNYRLSLQGVREIATYMFPPEYLDALEEIGGTCCRSAGFKAIAAYNGESLTIEIQRVRY